MGRPRVGLIAHQREDGRQPRRQIGMACPPADVGRGDGAPAKAVERRQKGGRRNVGQQPRTGGRRAGQNDMARLKRPFILTGAAGTQHIANTARRGSPCPFGARRAAQTAHADLADWRAQLDGTPLRFQPGQGRIDEECSQVLTGQHEVAGCGRTAQAVTQHPQEDLGRGQFRRRVHGTDHQRVPQLPYQHRGLMGPRVPVSDGAHAHGGVPATQPCQRQCAQQVQPLAQRQAPRRQQRGQQRQGFRRIQPHRSIPGHDRGMAPPRQPQAGCVLPVHGHALHALAPQPVHQRQRVTVGAQQQVLPVVQHDAIGIRPGQRLAPGPATGLRRRFQNLHRHAGTPQVQRGRQPGPACPHDDHGRHVIPQGRRVPEGSLRRSVDTHGRQAGSVVMRGGRPVARVRQASQNLRSGVSAMRCVMTG